MNRISRNKKKYLDDLIVSEFVVWLSKVVNDEEGYQLHHSYQEETKGRSKVTKDWKCEGLYDAYSKYNWSFSFYNRCTKEKKQGSNFNESTKVLDTLSEGIIRSIENQDREDCSNACLSILEWGGVLGSEDTGNMQKICLIKPFICDYLKNIRDYFNNNGLSLGDKHYVTIDGMQIPIIMNSGFTKIYSLLCDDFIIYDGRVGAAFGLLVRKFCESKSENEVPPLIAFHYGKAQNKNVNRNPSTDLYKFNHLSSDMTVHIEDNVKANWIVQKILEGDCPKFKDIQKNRSRALEAALFMIGYRL